MCLLAGGETGAAVQVWIKADAHSGKVYAAIGSLPAVNLSMTEA